MPGPRGDLSLPGATAVPTAQRAGQQCSPARGCRVYRAEQWHGRKAVRRNRSKQGHLPKSKRVVQSLVRSRWHTTLGKTPAMAARLTGHQWTMDELLTEAEQG